MTYSEFVASIRKKQSLLCVGLDTDINLIPKHLLKFNDPVFEFNKQIIEVTHDVAIAYKPNIAFYESMGSTGWKSLEKTIAYLNEKYPEIYTIADAKRGDIGNTSKKYAETFFKQMNFDALTVSPYMGSDSIRPFMEYENKWVIILSLTSNEGASDFQFTQDKDSQLRLFETVITKSIQWGTEKNTMFVVGATKAEMLKRIRQIIPNHFLLIPGVGAQGGSVKEVIDNGSNKDYGIIINSSRNIIYADSTVNFAVTAKQKSSELQMEMKNLMVKI